MEKDSAVIVLCLCEIKLTNGLIAIAWIANTTAMITLLFHLYVRSSHNIHKPHKVDNKFHRETIISFSVALSSTLYHNGNTVTADTRTSGLVCYLPAKGSFSCSVSFLRGKHVMWRFLPWTTRAMLDCPCTMSSYWALLVSLLHLWLDMRKMLPLLSLRHLFYSVRL